MLATRILAQTYSPAIRALDGAPFIIIVLVVVGASAFGTWLAATIIRRRRSNDKRIARENGVIGVDGLVVPTTSKWGFRRTGYILVDDSKITLQDKQRNTVLVVMRSDLESVNYKYANNFTLILNLRDGTSEIIYTYSPASGNPYPGLLAERLEAVKL